MLAQVQEVHEKPLLRAYYKKLISSGVSAEEFPWEVMLHHYQIGLVLCQAYTIFAGERARHERHPARVLLDCARACCMRRPHATPCVLHAAGAGGAGNGPEGIALGKVMYERYAAPLTAWNVFGAIKYNMSRDKGAWRALAEGLTACGVWRAWRLAFARASERVRRRMSLCHTLCCPSVHSRATVQGGMPDAAAGVQTLHPGGHLRRRRRGRGRRLDGRAVADEGEQSHRRRVTLRVPPTPAKPATLAASAQMRCSKQRCCSSVNRTVD